MQNQERNMTRIAMIAVAALVAASSTQAVAQQNVARPGWSPNNQPYVSDHQRQGDQRRMRGYQANRFGPGAFAAGVVGGAIGTAAAIASAPFTDSYAYYGGGYDDRSSYARRNGFVCEPGTWFRGEDGRLHPCQ
jgi:hypothetical protein